MSLPIVWIWDGAQYIRTEYTFPNSSIARDGRCRIIFLGWKTPSVRDYRALLPLICTHRYTHTHIHRQNTVEIRPQRTKLNDMLTSYKFQEVFCLFFHIFQVSITALQVCVCSAYSVLCPTGGCETKSSTHKGSHWHG